MPTDSFSAPYPDHPTLAPEAGQVQFKIPFHDPHAPNEPSFTPRKHFKLSSTAEIILETQQKAKDWANFADAEKIWKISKKLIDGLEITIKDGKPMEVPTFSIGPMNRKCFGKYNPGRNGFGIPETVSVNERRLSELEDGDIALHMVMLLVLCWRHQTGGSGNLDETARAKLRSFGLILGKRGIDGFDPDGRFVKALASGGIGKPPVIAPPAAGEGNSSNRLWSCNCQRARIGRGKFLAHCPECGREFLLGDHVGKYPEGTNVTDTPLAERRED